MNVSLFDTAMALLGYNFQTFWEKGVEPARCGSSHESLCPYQAFETAEGPIMIGVANDNLWRKFCAVVGLQDVFDDERFRTNADRVKHRSLTLDLVQTALLGRSAVDWYEALSRAGVPCSPINGLKQVLDHPHTAATGIVLDYEHPTAGPLKGIGQPVLFNGTPRASELPPPNLGQHTGDIMENLGFDTAEIDDLKSRKVIA